MIKSKKQMFLVIGVFALVMMLSAVTYAFFNYTRTGVSNTIKVGRISFVTRELDTINLTNVFPISSSEATGENPNYGEVVIEIVGDTDYTGGIEYLVSAVDASIYTNTGQPVPISLDVKIDDDLGTENNNYFTARDNTNTSIYKRIVGDTLVGDGMLLVGYIAPNSVSGTPDGIDATITIKAYLDKDKILISDTYDGTESDNMGTPNSMAQGKTLLTTTEWNALQSSSLSFKVKVEANEGIWVNGSLEEIMRKNNIGIDIENGVDFSKASDEDGLNGEGTKGVYMIAGTQNDAYPILYYRGEVEDNNVVFANKCWKAVRTTDTGGVKLLYNGEVSHVYKDDNYDLSAYTDVVKTGNEFVFDTETNEWKVKLVVSTSEGNSGEANIKFKVAEAGNYTLKFNNPGSGPITATRAGTSLNPTSGVNEIALNALTTSEEINIAYTYYNAPGATVIMKISLYKGNQIDLGEGCDNSGANSQITVNGENTFKFATEDGQYGSPAYNGYMYGAVYTYSTSNWTSNAKFGSSFTWDGTNYKLVDASETTPNATHHYSCNSADADATCTELRYVHYVSGSTKDYVTLTGGDSIEKAIEKMQTNTTNSNAKSKIDTWYASNMTGVTNKLEDVIWCNDRSMNNTNGWNPNGNLSEVMNYGALNRNPYQNTAQPNLGCPNENDAFGVNVGNRKLTYPVGMLTADEIILAGGAVGYASNYYLKSGNFYWSLSPYYFNYYIAFEFNVNAAGFLGGSEVNDSFGIRPSVSLKPGTPVVSGDGTVTSPYVIE